MTQYILSWYEWIEVVIPQSQLRRLFRLPIRKVGNWQRKKIIYKLENNQLIDIEFSIPDRTEYVQIEEFVEHTTYIDDIVISEVNNERDHVQNL